MYVQSESYAEVTAVIYGYDAATLGGALAGFREWLIVRQDGGNNLDWFGLVQNAAAQGKKNPSEQDKIATLLSLITEFAEYRDTNGLARAFVEHRKWVEQQEWYGPGHPTWEE